MLSFGQFQKRYSKLGPGRARKAAAKYRLAMNTHGFAWTPIAKRSASDVLRFGFGTTVIGPMKAAFEDVMGRVVATGKPGRFKVFTTGPIRALYFRNPDAEIFANIAATADAIRSSTGYDEVVVAYLPFKDEAKYGFETMVADPQTPVKIRAALDAARLSPAHVTRSNAWIIVIQSGTTTCQVGLYNVVTNRYNEHDVELFEYGAKNQDPAEFERMMQWIAAHRDIQIVLDAGAHGYAVQPGKVATTTTDLLPAADRTKEAVDSATRIMNHVNTMSKTYVLPQRKLCELKTSAADFMATLPENHGYNLLDWGGGQLQDPVLGIKSTGFEQRAIL